MRQLLTRPIWLACKLGLISKSRKKILNRFVTHWDWKIATTNSKNARCRLILMKKYGQTRCLKCGSQNKLTVDHIIPKSQGGSNHLENMQILCATCNREKGSRLEGRMWSFS